MFNKYCLPITCRVLIMKIKQMCISRGYEISPLTGGLIWQIYDLKLNLFRF
jgi:hypothetical protein